MEKDDPANAADWGPERTVRAELIYWLCTDKAAVSLVHAKGITIAGAKIADKLDFECVDIPYNLGLLGCSLENINLRDASARSLAFDSCIIGGFSADRFETSGGLFMRNVKVAGEVRLLGGNIGGDLCCTGAEFNNPSGMALMADGIKVKGNVFLSEKFKAKGEVRLLGAEIGGGLECDGADFNNPNGNALFADRLTIKGSIYLRNGFKASGEVRLLGAEIGASLDCTGAEFYNPGGNALSADRLKTGAVFLRKVKANGEVRFHGAEIGGSLDCIGAVFNNPKNLAFNCVDARIKGGLLLKEMISLTGALGLVHAKVGALIDDEKSWPEKGKLYIDGFEYGGLPGAEPPKSARKRLEWLALQPTKPFYPRPYEQLAKVFQDMGHDSDAKKVLIAKHEGLREHGKLSRRAWWGNWFLGKTIGHGYETWRAGVFLLALWAWGWFFYGLANFEGLMLCTKQCVGNTFNSFMYSWDVLLPVINFHQKDYFSSDATNFWGEMVRVYFWIQIALGWVFTTLAVASLTGLVRRLKE
jgi:hypothetical protein